MAREIHWLVNQHSGRAIVVDTNILLLLFLGECLPNLVGRFKRAAQFAPEDWPLLARLLSLFPAGVVTTPCILTEVNSLGGQLYEPARSTFLEFLSRRLPSIEERYSPSAELALHRAFIKFGLADSSIAQLAEAGHLVLTDDFRLSQFLGSKGHAVLNFNHVRVLGWK
jgi:hypothetical protein